MVLGYEQAFVQGGPVRRRTAFGGVAPAGMVQQDAAHQGSGNREKVAAVVILHLALSNETQVRLIDEGGGLQSVTGALAAHAGGSQAAEFIVNQRDELVSGLGIAAA